MLPPSLNRKAIKIKNKRCSSPAQANRIKTNMADENTEAVVVTPVEPVVTPVVEPDALTLAQEKLAKAEEERDNYKAVALKRLGKLPGDAEFLNGGEDTEMTVAEQVRLQLLDREVEITRKEEKDAQAKLIKENAELRLLVSNKPNNPLGGSAGATSEVKDSVFSEAQLAVLTQKANRLKVDPVTFIANAKKNLQS